MTLAPLLNASSTIQIQCVFGNDRIHDRACSVHSTERHDFPSGYGLGLGPSHGGRECQCIVYSYAERVGDLEPNPSAGNIHAPDASGRCYSRPRPPGPQPPAGDGRSFHQRSRHRRRLHVHARAHHARRALHPIIRNPLNRFTRRRYPGNAEGVIRDRYECRRLLRSRIGRKRPSGKTSAAIAAGRAPSLDKPPGRRAKVPRKEDALDRQARAIEDAQ